MKNKILTMQDVFDGCSLMVDTFKDNFSEVDFVVGISRGGLIPATLIATKINKPLVAAYIDKEDSVYFDKPEWIKDKNVMIIDDIVRTGKTLIKIRNLIRENGAKSVDCAVLAAITGDLELDPLRNFDVEKGWNVIFPWDYDFMEEENNNSERVKY